MRWTMQLLGWRPQSDQPSTTPQPGNVPRQAPHPQSTLEAQAHTQRQQVSPQATDDYDNYDDDLPF